MSAAWKEGTDLPPVYARAVEVGTLKRDEVIHRISQPTIGLEPLYLPAIPLPIRLQSLSYYIFSVDYHRVRSLPLSHSLGPALLP